MVTHLFKKFPLLLRTCSFNIMSKTAYKWNLYWASWTLYSLLSSLFKIRFNSIHQPRTSTLIAGSQIKVLCEFLKLIYYESVLQNLELMLLTIPHSPPRRKNSVLMNGLNVEYFYYFWSLITKDIKSRIDTTRQHSTTKGLSSQATWTSI